MDLNNANEIDINQWVVVNSPGGRYLGRIVTDRGSLSDTSVRESILDQVSQGDVLELNPAFDFMSPLRPIQHPDGRVGMQRDAIVVPVDFTTNDTSVFVKVSSIYFCALMTATDKDTYLNYVRDTLTMQLGQRAQRSGLVMPGAPVAEPSHRNGRVRG
jgi:hypothetical protein